MGGVLIARLFVMEKYFFKILIHFMLILLIFLNSVVVRAGDRFVMQSLAKIDLLTP